MKQGINMTQKSFLQTRKHVVSACLAAVVSASPMALAQEADEERSNNRLEEVIVTVERRE